MMKKSKQSLMLLCSSLFLASCSMAPKYNRPELPIAERFPGMDQTTLQEIKLVSWRSYFNDPRLINLIELALENNRDLRLAALKVQAARLEYGLSQSERLPGISASGGNTRSGSLIKDDTLLNLPQGQRSNGSISQRYNIGYGITDFELDFFGRLKSLSDAAFYDYLATEQGRKSAQIILISQVAQLYVNERLNLEQLEVANSTLKANQTSYQLIQQQVTAGIASDLDLKQAETQVLSGKVAVAVYERQSLQAQNALVQMVGSDATKTLPAGLTLDKMSFDKNLPVTFPSVVLLNRPDIIAAERTLMAANANIGAARAAVFPRISLGATIAYANPVLGSLINSQNGAWNTSISGSVPIFAWGKYKNSLDLAIVGKETSIANYEKTIQNAFKEVADAIVAKQPLASQVKSQIALAAAEQERLNLSQLLYNNGVASYLDVLDAQRTLFSARQAVLTARTTEIINSINLFSALGGGYDELDNSPNNAIHAAVPEKNQLRNMKTTLQSQIKLHD